MEFNNVSSNVLLYTEAWYVDLVFSISCNVT